MKKTALALAILLATGAANAIGFGNDNPSSSNDNRNTNTNVNAPSQDQGQAQGQLQGQAQGQLQGQAQATSVNVHASPRSSSMSGAAAFSGGNTQAVTVTDSGRMRYSGSYSVKSTGIAPDIIANPTAPCRIATSVSGAGVGFGFGFGGSVLDDGCDTRADATMLLAAGEPDAAIARLCQKAEMAKALGGRCGAPVTGPSAPAISSTPATYGAGFKH